MKIISFLINSLFSWLYALITQFFFPKNYNAGHYILPLSFKVPTSIIRHMAIPNEKFLTNQFVLVCPRVREREWERDLVDSFLLV